MIPLLLVVGLLGLVGALCYVAFIELRAWQQRVATYEKKEGGEVGAQVASLSATADTPLGSPVKAAFVASDAEVAALTTAYLTGPTSPVVKPVDIISGKYQYPPTKPLNHWEPRMRVQHHVYGSGTVESVHDGSVTVNFRDYGAHRVPASQLLSA
jgi:hypothetical protein